MDRDETLEQLILNILDPSFYSDEIVEEYKEKYKDDLVHLKKVLSKMKPLNNNFFHGKCHGQRVALFAFILGLNNDLNEIDMQILLDAAMYHDCGKINDYEDEFHGIQSANIIEKYIDSEIYVDSNNLDILKCVIAAHSISDGREKSTYYTFVNDEANDSEEKYQRYLKLQEILKDADALDRVRFWDDPVAGLDIKYLRSDKSKKMVAFAIAVYEIYIDLVKLRNKNKFISGCELGDKGCFHSIGFNFFKIKSILEHGILSHTELEKNSIDTPRNFEGGNGADWISVVDERLISDFAYLYEGETEEKNTKNTAYGNFTKHGIGFYCLVKELYEANDDFCDAFLNGQPFNKSNYPDERYVYQKISQENIKFLLVPYEYLNTDISKLNYLFNNLNINHFRNYILFYLNQTNNSDIKLINSELISLIKKYEICVNNFLSYSNDKNVFIKSLNDILDQINTIVAGYVSAYFKKQLGKQNDEIVTTLDVVLYLLKENKIDYNIVSQYGKEVIISINFQKETKPKSK